MMVPGVCMDACGGTVVAGAVVTVPGVWLVQPVTSTAALTKQSRRINTVRDSIIKNLSSPGTYNYCRFVLRQIFLISF